MNVICVDFPMSPKVMKEFKKRFKYKYDMKLAVLFRLSVNLIEKTPWVQRPLYRPN